MTSLLSDMRMVRPQGLTFRITQPHGLRICIWGQGKPIDRAAHTIVCPLLDGRGDFAMRLLISELIDTSPWKRGSDCRSVSLFHDLFNSASERPSTPSEADDHHDESAGGCALQ